MRLNLGEKQLFQSVIAYLGLGGICLLSLQMAWTGFVSSDDAYYVEAGLGWFEQFPYVAHHFGTVRAAIAIPIALMIYLFGESELSVTLSTALFLVATAGLTLFMLGNLVGRAAALLTCLVLVTLPIFALKATIPCADIPELFFAALSFWLFWRACWAKKRVALLLVSGISAGFAFSAHELTIALIFFYLVLFLRAYKIPRHTYLWMALGFAAVIIAESIYYWITTGNPAHRFMLLLHATTVHDRVQVGFLEIAAGGTLHIWGPIDPLVMLLTHHDFGILGWASIPAIWWLVAYQWQNPSKPVALARLALGFSLAWCIISAVLLRDMILLPRYYMVAAYCLLIVCAVWASTQLWPQWQRLAIGMVTISLIANLLSIAIDNKNPRFAERSLVAHLKRSQGTVFTDPLTAHNAEWYCRWEGVDCSRIIAGVPKPEAAYFWNPKATSVPNRFVSKDELAHYRPSPSWEKMWSLDESPRPITILIKLMRLTKVVPASLWGKLSHPNPAVLLYIVRE